MRRSASEVIRDLEMRVARLERQAGEVKMWTFKVPTDVPRLEGSDFTMDFFKKGEGIKGTAKKEGKFLHIESGRAKYIVPAKAVEGKDR